MRGFQKAMSRSATPVVSRDNYTPMPSRKNSQQEVRFTSPRLPAKRRAFGEHELSPDSKQQYMSENTPHRARGRSFSVKNKFNGAGRGRKKSLKDGVDVNNLYYSPLPSKPSIDLSLATPATPASVDLPRQGCDISSPQQQPAKNVVVDVCDSSSSSTMKTLEGVAQVLKTESVSRR